MWQNMENVAKENGNIETVVLRMTTTADDGGGGMIVSNTYRLYGNMLYNFLCLVFNWKMQKQWSGANHHHHHHHRINQCGNCCYSHDKFKTTVHKFSIRFTSISLTFFPIESIDYYRMNNINQYIYTSKWDIVYQSYKIYTG